eukprot:Hpha_TRINITY_DN15293_c1_g2::TRINITY_DN15293_c1_g2_i1::g.67523::m.67523
MSGKLRCVSGPAELFGKGKANEVSNDRNARRAPRATANTPSSQKYPQPRARPPTTQRPHDNNGAPTNSTPLPEVGFEVWGAPPPPPPGVSSGEQSGFHGWSHIHDPIEAAEMHRQLIELHYASLSQHFRMMWHHQNMAHQAGAAVEGVAPARLPAPQMPLMPPPVMIPEREIQSISSDLPRRLPARTDRKDGDDDQNSQGLTDQGSSKDAESTKDSDA